MTATLFEMDPDFPMIGKGRHRRGWFVRFAIYQINGSWMADGKRIPEPFPEIVGEGETGPVTVPDYMLSLNGWSLFSERFKTVIEAEFPNAMQFIPFHLKADASVIRSGEFFIGQVLQVVDALDFERTTPVHDWTRRENGTYAVDYSRPVYIIERLIRHCPVFRLDGAPSTVWVGAAFRQLVQDNGITGCRFRQAHVS